MQNPFSPGDRVITKFMGAEVEVPVIQIYNHEVQIRTADKVLRWRTSKTVWFLSDKANAEPIRPSPAEAQAVPEPVPTVPEPDQSDAKPVVEAGIPSPAEVSPKEAVLSQAEEASLVPPPAVDQPLITTCGQEESEELRRARSKGKRRANRRRG